MKKIVIVDTGIDLSNTKNRANSLYSEGFLFYKSEHEQIEILNTTEDSNCIQDEIGHGTCIAEIISNHNNDVELIIAKIFSSESQMADEELLSFALEYILDNVEFDILNLSMGIAYISSNSRLRCICEKYYSKGKIIVSAYDNAGSLTFPALFDCVVGVTSSELCHRNSDFYLTDNNLVNVCANGRRQRVLWKDGLKIILSGNSIACAHFTGILSKYDHLNINSLYELIKPDSLGQLCLGQESIAIPSSPVSRYKKAVAFPFNKEIHNLVRFSGNLPFDLVDIYDISYSARVGANTDTLLHEKCSRNYVIKNINNINYDDFDVFILGHTDELLSVVSKNDFKKSLVTKLLNNKKNIYSFDSINEIMNVDGFCDVNHNPNVFCPNISIENRYIAPFGKLYRIDKPVVGVFGTSSSQGKFTLQLLIRYEMIRREYSVCQLGTEPSSLLYGMDCVFPTGYNSTSELYQCDVVAYINNILYQTSRNADLILVGGQSGLVLREEGNLVNFYFKQLDFLFATMPDLSILCVNPDDDFDIIRRAIGLIESSVNCNVVALSMFPFYSDDIYGTLPKKFMTYDLFLNVYKPLFEIELGIRVFYPNEKMEIQELCDLLINKLREE